ncbi:helix-turn-helix transcriptional regulator [Erysipelothrix sp. HDW6C]|uniref:PadR family transcriptional regulator n=1 Tax=Erysipelothrix sp. HDW6C TaxID=2714930 RepID=UPI0014096F61|nr:PadR family transcriptional regulator [Erysipelothrix sp. HDW6C]QIK69498.1 helix-turn-helix transcriptional regulator [Erysipelothrix sp. HDW6C]
MSITSDLIRGHTETIILAQLMIKDSYGYEINKAVRETTNGDYELKEATLYSAFRRLEDQGMISSYWGDQDSGARRRYYTITIDGKRTYERNIEDWHTAQVMINALITIGGKEHE